MFESYVLQQSVQFAVNSSNMLTFAYEYKKVFLQMAGLYIHVPFCSKRCLYCDFFSNTEMRYKTSYLASLIREMGLRASYLSGESIETIYFGGGTPSQLSVFDFQLIFEAIQRHFAFTSDMEITLEANPDDLSSAYIQSLRTLPFNRLSMGIQSFHEDDLRLLNRRHTAAQAKEAVDRCQQAGLTNISIDLIYGLPGQTEVAWEDNLAQALALQVPHLSAYHLTYEEGTALYRLWKEGKVQPVEEELSLAFFNTLIDRLVDAGYQHYEISNFARTGFYARHNCSYWTGKTYLGLGPSAHSYNGREREWNVASLPIYIKGIEEGKPSLEWEELSLSTRYNDFIITRLRTQWGICCDELVSTFGEKWLSYCLNQAQRAFRQGLLTHEEGRLRLSRRGLFLSDGVMSDLLWV